MNFRADESRSRTLPLDLTAMVDVVFLLIIFFLTTTSLIDRTRVRLDLPVEAGREDASEVLPSLVVNVTADGRYIVDGDEMTTVGVLDIVDVLSDDDGGNLDLLVRADRAAALVHVNELARGLAARNISGWRLATERPAGGGGGR